MQFPSHNGRSFFRGRADFILRVHTSLRGFSLHKDARVFIQCLRGNIASKFDNLFKKQSMVASVESVGITYIGVRISSIEYAYEALNCENIS